MTTAPAVAAAPSLARPTPGAAPPEPATLGTRRTGVEVIVKVFVAVPFLALLVAVPFA
jgi:hypothetical protein